MKSTSNMRCLSSVVSSTIIRLADALSTLALLQSWNAYTLLPVAQFINPIPLSFGHAATEPRVGTNQFDLFISLICQTERACYEDTICDIPSLSLHHPCYISTYASSYTGPRCTIEYANTTLVGQGMGHMSRWKAGGDMYRVGLEIWNGEKAKQG